MNEETTKLLEQLAQKLGTTTEYLWAILVKQAPIDSAITLFQFALIGIFGYALFRTHKWLCASEKYEKSRYEYYEEYATYPMAVAFAIFVILAVFAFFCIEEVIYGFLNPEYWALKRVFSLIK